MNAATRAREHRATKAIESNLGAELNKEVQKKLLTAIIMLKFSKMPALNLVCAASKSEDAFGHSNSTSQCHAVQGITAVRAGIVAAWPELSFEALRDSEDVVRTMLLGKAVIKIDAEVSERAAAAMFTMVGKHIEDRAEAFRQGQICVGTPVSDMIDNDKLREKIEKKRDELKNTTELMSQTTSTGTPATPMRTITEVAAGSKKKLTTLFTEWRQRFGHGDGSRATGTRGYPLITVGTIRASWEMGDPTTQARRAGNPAHGSQARNGRGLVFMCLYRSPVGVCTSEVDETRTKPSV